MGDSGTAENDVIVAASLRELIRALFPGGRPSRSALASTRLAPNATLHGAMALLVLLASAWNVFAVGVRIAFLNMGGRAATGTAGSERSGGSGSGVLESGEVAAFALADVLADVVVLVHVAVGLLSARLVRGHLVTERRELTRAFFCDWHNVLDLVSLLPLHVGSWHDQFLYPLLRVHKILQVLNFDHWYNAVYRITSSASVYLALRRMRILHLLFLIIHLAAVTYFLVISTGGFDADDGWTTDPEMVDRGIVFRYGSGFWWAATTMTGAPRTGLPVTTLQMAFATVLLFVGVILLAYVIGEVGDVMAAGSHLESQARERVMLILSFARFHNLPDALINRIVSYLDFINNRQDGISDDEIFEDLPDHLKTEVMIHLVSNMLEKVPFFADASPGFIRSLVVLLRPAVYIPGEAVVKEGEIGSEMFFLSKGRVRAFNSNFSAMMEEGSFFGEIALMYRTCRTASIEAATHCDMFILDKDDLQSVLKFFPEQDAIMRSMAAKRIAATGGGGASKRRASSASDSTVRPRASTKDSDAGRSRKETGDSLKLKFEDIDVFAAGGVQRNIPLGVLLSSAGVIDKLLSHVGDGLLSVAEEAQLEGFGKGEGE